MVVLVVREYCAARLAGETSPPAIARRDMATMRHAADVILVPSVMVIYCWV
jgi:hypothetical protein